MVLTGLTQSYSQNSHDAILDNLNASNFRIADSLIDVMPSSKKKSILAWQLNFLVNGKADLTSPKISEDSDPLTILYILQKGDIALKAENDNQVAFEAYRNAFIKAQKTKDVSLIKFSLYKINKLLYPNPELSNLLNDYVKEFASYRANANDSAYYDYYYYVIKSLKEQKEQIAFHKTTLKQVAEADIPYIKGKTNQMIGIQFDHYLKNKDSAIHYYKIALENFEKVTGINGKFGLFGAYNNLGVSFGESGNFQKAISYFNKAKQHIDDDLHKKSYLYLAISQAYNQAKNKDSAYYYLEAHRKSVEELKDHESAVALEAIETKYQTAEKEKQILVEQGKKERNSNIAIGLGSGLIAVIIIGFLAYKNTKKKKDIAEKQREIEINKTEKILKEQEINTIDAMISGQEKERQRLASDLHDSVGATLAAARLQFEHLHKNRDKGAQTNELFDKTSKLLEDAYTEVRTMSHIKNSGVIAKQGLLPAVQKLARNASVTSALNIEVQDFGLNERLENTLEISVFRILQELVTNIIKHAEASEASIAITQHEESLSIIVEDNGKGFTPLQIQKKEGMGLNSIERRIEHIEGTMEIDSTPGKGTSILIDIPL